MVLARHADALRGWQVEILASDLSQAMIERAQTGEYSQLEVQKGLQARELLQHFTQDGPLWRVSPHLARAIEFRVINLVDELPAIGRFDIVLCRNLLICLEARMKSELLRRVARTLAPDGWLVLGAAESVIGLDAGLQPDPAHGGLYIRSPAAIHEPA